MTEELRRKMEVFNRKAFEAERDGYAVCGGIVWEPKHDCSHEMRQVCPVDDYVSQAERAVTARVARLIAERHDAESKRISADIAVSLAMQREQLVNEWGCRGTRFSVWKRLSRPCTTMGRASALPAAIIALQR